MFDLAYCGRCDGVYVLQAPSTEDLIALLPVDFGRLEQELAPEAAKPILDFYAAALRCRDLLPPGSRLLEVDAGPAWVSRAAKTFCADCLVTAQDPRPQFAAHCSWVDQYHVGDLESLPAQGPYDLVSLTHVIQRAVRPAALLGQAVGRIRRGGVAYVTAPFRPRRWAPRTGLAPWLDFAYFRPPAGLNYLSREWFEQQGALLGLSLEHWDASHDGEQVFEVVLRKS